VNQLTTPTQRVAEDNLYDATPRQSEFPAGQQDLPREAQSQSQSPPQPPPQSPLRQKQEQQQQQQPPNHVTNNNIVITAPVEPKSAGLSHEVVRPANPGAASPSPPAATPAPPVITFDPPKNDESHQDLDEDLEFDSDMDESPIIQDASIATLKQASPSQSPTATTTGGSAAAPAQNGGAAAKDNVAIFERAKKKAEEQREMERRMMLEEKIPVFDADADEGGPGGKQNGDGEAAPVMSATSYPGQEWNPYGEGGFEDWE